MRLLCKEECLVNTNKNKGRGWSLFTAILVLFMPKCAFCWAAYMSLFSSIGIVIHYQPWFVPLAAVLFIITLIKLLIAAVRRRNFIAVGFAVVAAALILLERKVPGMNMGKLVAIVLMIVAVKMDGLRMLYTYFFATETHRH